jgi:hypothetical protein
MLYMPCEWITRAEAGRRLGVSPMAVTKFTRRGMPHRSSDGKVPWPDGLYWSDWYRYGRDEAERAARELRWLQAAAWYQMRRAGMDAASIANRVIGWRAAHAG